MVERRSVSKRSKARWAAPIKVTLLDADGKAPRTLELQSDWWPGEPVWTGMVHDKHVSVQVRPILNGYDLAYRGIHAPAHVYTEREAALAALMPEKAAGRHLQVAALPHAGPGQGDPRRRRARRSRPATRLPSSRP